MATMKRMNKPKILSTANCAELEVESAKQSAVEETAVNSVAETAEKAESSGNAELEVESAKQSAVAETAENSVAETAVNSVAEPAKNSVAREKRAVVEIKNVVSREMAYLGENHFSHIVKDVSFNLYEGEILGLGAKTVNEEVVICEIIANIRAYKSGECSVLGEALHRKKRLQKAEVYFIDSATMLFDNMNVLEYLMLLTTEKPSNEAERQLRILEKLEKFGLDYIALSVISKLSDAEKILVEMFAALFSNAKLFVVNVSKFSFSGREISALLNIANDIRTKNLTMLIATMQPKIIGIICDKVAYISGGKLRYYGEVRELIKQKDDVRFLINDSNLQSIYQQLRLKVPEYTYNLVGDTLFVLDDKERTDDLFLAKIACNNIVPDRIKVNRGRVGNSFERLDSESDL
ncbi:MAG: hypothetical protein RR338_04180 [Clostridia bacterium]